MNKKVSDRFVSFLSFAYAAIFKQLIGFDCAKVFFLSHYSSSISREVEEKRRGISEVKVQLT